MTYTEQQISEATGFDQGDQFASAQQVRDYFAVENMRHMGFDEDAISNQDLLDEMADAVIAHRWHMDSTAREGQS